MTVNRLSFATIEILSSDLAEIIIDDGIEVDLEMLTEYHNWISQTLSDPCMLLINKVNSYAYSFNAQLTLTTLKQVKATAVVTYDAAKISSTEVLASLPRERAWNLKLFTTKDEALLWLKTQI